MILLDKPKETRREPAMADTEDFNGNRQREIAANFADYEKSAAPREIPVLLLDPVA